MAAYDDYQSLGITIPTIILFLFYFFSAAAALYLMSKSVEFPKGFVYRLPRMIRLVLKNVFVGLKINEINNDETSVANETHYFEVCIHDKRLNRKSVLSMIVMVLNVFGCSVASLWTVLLIRESTNCGEEGFDCFSNKERVTDCNIFENGTEVNINGTDHQLECYRFVFDYVGGFTAAGGITFFARIVVNTLVFIFASIGEIRNAICRYLSVLSFLFIYLLIIIGFIFLDRYLPVFDDHSIPAKFTVSVYSFTLSISVLACLQMVADLSNISDEYIHVV